MILRLKIFSIPRSEIFWSILQYVVGIGALFVSYRMLIQSSGISGLGLWSILISMGSIARTADISGGGTLFRFIARERSNPVGRSGIYFETMAITNLLMTITIAIIAYALITIYLSFAPISEINNESIYLIPIALSSVIVLAPMVSLLASGLDGLLMIKTRAQLMIISYCFFVLSTFILIPILGLLGFALAQVGQQLFMIIIVWFIIQREISDVKFIPVRWDRDIFFETTSFGLKIQSIAIASVLTEPVAKALIGFYGGLPAVGLYELALRLLTQARGLLTAMVQPIQPRLASATSRYALVREIEPLFDRVLVQSAFMFGVTILIAPVYSFIMIGRVEIELLSMVVALALGFAVNGVAIPFHMLGTARGLTCWNFMAQLIVAVSVITVGPFLAIFFGTKGVVFSLTFGLVSAALFTIWGNCRELRLQLLSALVIRRTLGFGVILIIFAMFFGSILYFKDRI